ncbi:MAG: hypothetical protein QOG43_2878 [Actinomycetota bacterium]|jgi:hypothetical protein|nr:hypothetical protein [Actinomycetota bacterium]
MGSTRTDRAPGPLVVSRVNPRYFIVATDEQRAVYLTGSHIWNNLHDGMGPGRECSGTPRGVARSRPPRDARNRAGSGGVHA